MPDEQIPDEGLDFTCSACGFSTRLKKPGPRRAAPGQRASAATPAPAAPATAPSAPPPPPPAPAPQQDATVPDEATAAAPESSPEPAPEPAAPAAETAAPAVPRLGKLDTSGWLTAWLDVIGTGKGGESFTFWDLLRTLSAALDPRKLAAGALLVFAASLLAAGLGQLAGLAGNRVISIVAAVLGFVLLWLAGYLAVSLSAVLSEAEMQAGKRQPWGVAWRFVSEHLWQLLASPLRLLLVSGAGAALILVLGLLGRIPVAGPLLYGLTFFLALAAGLVVVASLLLLAVVQLTCPALLRGGLAEGGTCLRAVWRLVSARPGRFFAYLLLLTLASYVIVVIGSTLLLAAWGLVGWLGAKSMGPAISDVYLAIPYGLFSALVVLVPDVLLQVFMPAGQMAWYDSVAGWLVGLWLLLAFALVAAALLSYLGSAGVVLVKLLSARQSPARD